MVGLLRSTTAGFKDLMLSVRRVGLASLLGWQDVKQRYNRSALGPFWLTISMGVMVLTMGVVFGSIFNTPLKEFLPFLALGIIYWGFISSIISEGCLAFVSGEAMIKQLPMPMFVYVMRVVWRNFIILAHNIVIFPLVLIFVGRGVSWNIFWAIPGLILLVANLSWIALLLATCCARYRDLPQMVTSLLQVLFYLTPIMWLPDLLPKEKVFYLLDVNPVYHLMDIVRTPLMGSRPSGETWFLCSIMAVVGWIVTATFYGKYFKRIAFWV